MFHRRSEIEVSLTCFDFPSASDQLRLSSSVSSIVAAIESTAAVVQPILVFDCSAVPCSWSSHHLPLRLE